MLLKTLKFILPGRKLKILGSGRTDAKVSSLHGAFELFLEGDPLGDLMDFQEMFNKNLPPDIHITEISNILSSFNIIKDAGLKEYHYLFSFGEKNHPFCAPFMANFSDHLDIESMRKAAKLFKGTHYFGAYTIKGNTEKKLERTIDSCILDRNTLWTANFFPDKSFLLRVTAKGFLRYQVRMIMGALVLVGRGQISLEQVEASLIAGSQFELNYIAPGSGLYLHRQDFIPNI